MNGTCVYFVPSSRVIPYILIHTRRAAELYGKRIVAAIDTWEKRDLHPSGHFVRELGAIGDKDSESEALLIQYDIPYQAFSQNVLSVCLIHPPWLPLFHPSSTCLCRCMTRDRCATATYGTPHQIVSTAAPMELLGVTSR